MLLQLSLQVNLYLIFMMRGAERVWPTSAARGSVAVPNGEGVASGSATLSLDIYKNKLY